MKTPLTLIITILFLGCNNKISINYTSIDGEDKHIIDLKTFEVTTPTSYKFSPQKGIDSYVGKVRNHQTSFSFDYGWYSYSGPPTYYETFNKFFNRLYLSEFLDSINHNNDTIPNQDLQNLEILSVEYQDNGKFKSKIKLDSIIYDFNSITQHGGEHAEIENYYISTKIENGQYKKMYIPKVNTNETIGVYIEDLTSKKENPYGYNKLSFYTSNYNKKDEPEIISILESITLKKETSVEQ